MVCRYNVGNCGGCALVLLAVWDAPTPLQPRRLTQQGEAGTHAYRWQAIGADRYRIPSYLPGVGECPAALAGFPPDALAVKQFDNATLMMDSSKLLQGRRGDVCAHALHAKHCHKCILREGKRFAPRRNGQRKSRPAVAARLSKSI